MKKTIIIILAILPIVLLIVIAFAGQIMSTYEYNPVERVEFADRKGKSYPDDMTFKLEMNTQKNIYSTVFPTNADDQRVVYASADESICTIDQNGVIFGKHYGSTTISVTTMDGNMTDTIKVIVEAKVPYAVSLEVEKIDGEKKLALNVGDIYTFKTIVDAPVAINSNVTYESSDPSVADVSGSGKVTAKSAGTATITVTTESGGLTDTCVVTVAEGDRDLYFDFGDDNAFKLSNKEDKIYHCYTNTIDLSKYLKFNDEKINKDSIVVKISSGSDIASISGSILTITKMDKYITISAYVGDESNPLYFDEITLKYTAQPQN